MRGLLVVSCAVGLGWFCPEVARSQDRVVPPTPSMGPSLTPAASVAGASDPPPHCPSWPRPCQLQDDTSSPGLAHCWVPPPRVLGSQVWPALGKGRGAGLS